MTTPAKVSFEFFGPERAVEFTGNIVIFLDPNGMDSPCERLNEILGGTLRRLADSAEFKKMELGDAIVLAHPGGLTAKSAIVCKLHQDSGRTVFRRAGGVVGKKLDRNCNVLIFGGTQKFIAEFAFGLVLSSYKFTKYKTDQVESSIPISVTVSSSFEGAREEFDPLLASANGVYLTRDLVNEPSNVLSTTEFAGRLQKLDEYGLKVRVYNEDEIQAMEMRTLLAVGQGSSSPSRVVAIEWMKGDGAPLALVGKGVVFDTGGISLKPANGMEQMTMDMAGAAVVAGVMRTLAERNAKANVVGLVGLVENMPDGNAQRPGDVVKSLKGDTIEVINTDAEGRLVLADLLWHVQEQYKPAAIIDLATLTGAIIIGLGHEFAGVFSNDEALSEDIVQAAIEQSEGAWKMPMAKSFDKMLKSEIADIKNATTRDGAAITGAQFLKRFVKPECPWAHLDIAGVAATGSETEFAPKGATGWGVRTLNALIKKRFERR